MPIAKEIVSRAADAICGFYQQVGSTSTTYGLCDKGAFSAGACTGPTTIVGTFDGTRCTPFPSITSTAVSYMTSAASSLASTASSWATSAMPTATMAPTPHDHDDDGFNPIAIVAPAVAVAALAGGALLAYVCYRKCKNAAAERVAVHPMDDTPPLIQTLNAHPQMVAIDIEGSGDVMEEEVQRSSPKMVHFANQVALAELANSDSFSSETLTFVEKKTPSPTPTVLELPHENIDNDDEFVDAPLPGQVSEVITNRHAMPSPKQAVFARVAGEIDYNPTTFKPSEVGQWEEGALDDGDPAVDRWVDAVPEIHQFIARKNAGEEDSWVTAKVTVDGQKFEAERLTMSPITRVDVNALFKKSGN